MFSTVEETVRGKGVDTSPIPLRVKTENKVFKFMAHSPVWGHSPIQRQNTNSKKLTIEKLS